MELLFETRPEIRGTTECGWVWRRRRHRTDRRKLRHAFGMEGRNDDSTRGKRSAKQIVFHLDRASVYAYKLVTA